MRDSAARPCCLSPSGLQPEVLPRPCECAPETLAFLKFDVIKHLLFHKLPPLCSSTPGFPSLWPLFLARGLCSCVHAVWVTSPAFLCISDSPSSEGRRAEPSVPSGRCQASLSPSRGLPLVLPSPHAGPHFPLLCWACPQQGCRRLTCRTLTRHSCGSCSHRPFRYL